MPCREEVRKQAEWGVREERVKYWIRDDPRGQGLVLTPREALSVREEDGAVVVRKAERGPENYSGCRHERLSQEQEAALIRDTGKRAGFCRACAREFCPRCLLECACCKKSVCGECVRKWE